MERATAAVNSQCAGCKILLPLVGMLEGQLTAATGAIENLQKLSAEQAEKIAHLEARVNRNSNNSSQPPSADPPGQVHPVKRRPSGLKPGGQPGHEGHHRLLAPPERVKEVIAYIPTHCEHCRHPLPPEASPQDPPPGLHQVTELPRVVSEITEHQAHARTCPSCGKVTRAKLPREVGNHVLGPKLAASLAYLSARGQVSRRLVQEIAVNVFDAAISTASICKYEQELGASLEKPYAQVREEVLAAPAKNVDETSWQQHKNKCWLWLMATPKLAFFMIHPKRGQEGFEALVGTQPTGTLTTDRWCVYEQLSPLRHQICWPHLKRDFQKFSECQGPARKRLGEAGLKTTGELFAIWHAFRDGKIDRTAMCQQLKPVRREFKKTLEDHAAGTDKKAARASRKLLKHFPALWTFARVEGVEPSNNHAERCLRPAVMLRKRSFGNHSEAGCRFTERLLTVGQTLRLQGRNLLTFLSEAVRAHRTGQTAPSPIPQAIESG